MVRSNQEVNHTKTRRLGGGHPDESGGREKNPSPILPECQELPSRAMIGPEGTTERQGGHDLGWPQCSKPGKKNV